MKLIPTPSNKEVEKYIKKWYLLEDYYLQERSLDKLFLDMIPNNTTIEDILIKSSILNDFYSTNIFSIFPVAKHILELDIDERLKSGDSTLVDDIARVKSLNKRFYSFATKYCSHHNPLEYPIYDNYVDKVLKHFKKQDKFSNFKSNDLKDYVRFKEVLFDFKEFYEIDYNLKELDKYLWQIGKEYFPKKYY